MDKSTTTRVNESTLERLRITSAEMTVYLGVQTNSDDERINSLIDFWDLHKEDVQRAKRP